ncbi:SIR2 family protein, partial [Lactococcus garvieae]
YSKFYQKIFEYRTPESDKLSIFTPNYDLFTEYALEYNNISYATGFTTDLTNKFDINQFKYRLVDDTNRYKNKWQPVKKEANLYKMHGSINWVQDSEGQLYQRNYKKLESERVVIYPTQLKHQETAQTPYSELFREFSNCLQKPNT